MPTPEVFTYSDALDNLRDFAQAWQMDAAQSMLRRSVRRARDEIAVAHHASFLIKRQKILLRAAQTTGTVEFDYTGHATCERALVLTDATWPDWAVDAVVRFDDMICPVQEVKSTTVLQLDVDGNPGQDVASGTSYTLYPRCYPLPTDFRQVLSIAEESSWQVGSYVDPTAMFELDRYDTETGNPRYYTVAEVPDQLGRMGLWLFPPSDTTEPIDILYRRKLRDLRYSGHNSAEFAGTIAVTASSPTVAGTSTSFESGMAGSILRISATSTKPTGLEGTNAWAEQRVIKSVTNATTLTLDGNVSTTRASASYVISDPIDIDNSFWSAFLACCEKHLAIARNAKSKAELIILYRDALQQAKAGDARTGGRRVCGTPQTYTVRLADAATRSEVP